MARSSWTCLLEQVADPKDVLFGLLRSASELSGRRLSAFDVNRSRRRVAEFVSDFSPLRALESFRRLEENVATALSKLSS